MYEYTGEVEFEEKIVQVNRVSKKTAGGNKIGFSVLVVVGDRKGRVGVGLGKAPSVQDAIKKGALYAKKHLISVPMVEATIPHEVYIKRGAAKVLLKPASRGTGVIAGGAVRAVVEAAGVHDILSKVLGTSNQASNVYATMDALKKLVLIEKKVEVKIEKPKPTVVGSSDKEPVKKMRITKRKKETTGATTKTTKRKVSKK
ncbi:MAG: 30S ribosomal protein S5 [Candidatus Woykebacteria bacterium RBG_16_43_9]|uniref:Small ribosomal subunit protein uS5 n=1 Tax=Candidatus Woykebacteria bacterium RBG_16_43_9 TaxID=1802596 RepID=A0A1G1WGD6_9BACT|nr:MAG: 30S ribosomal protein S5 [Candidatus Woykebacteria bacterium RBG_16_43_9]